MIVLRLALAGVLAAGLVGCANKPASLYQWQGYQKNVHEYLRGDKTSLSEQTQAMQADLQKIQASGAAVPPGYSAHLGLLYAKQGDMSGFAQQLDAEKQRFPESETFVDFLLRNFKK